jgi:WhiB family redox-sensing transcriptional regulator
MSPRRLGPRDNPLFSSKEKARAWLQLADMVHDAGVDQIPCSNAPDLFFPDNNDPVNSAQINIQHAVRMCKESCPIMSQCGAYAIRYDEHDGVWGGLTAAQRRRLRKVPR